MKVSVVIPTYQRCKLLRRTLDAVFNQDFPPSEFEVVVVIDGSQDGTLEMLQSLRPCCRLRFLSQENRGQAAAKNAGIQVAEGDLLFFLDDDILLPPDALRRHVEQHDGSAQVLFAAIGVSDDSHPGFATEYTREFAESFYGALERGNISYFPNYVNVLPNSSVPRQVIVESGGFDERFFRAHEDTELAYRLHKRGVQFRFIEGARAVQVYEKDVRALAEEAEHDGRQDVLFSSLHPEYRMTSDLAPLGGWKKRCLWIAAMCAPELAVRLVLELLVLMDRFHRVSPCRRLGRRMLNLYVRAMVFRSAASSAGGVRSFLDRFWRRVPVLMSHDVIADRADALPGSLSISADVFARQMDWLKRRGYRAITPSQWLQWCKVAQPLPRKPVIITFDDGYTTLAANAFPVLKRCGFAATVYVVTAEMGGTNRWDREQLFPQRDLLSADEIRRVRGEGVEFAPHSRTHAHLLNCTTEQMRSEICGSATDLMAVTGVRADSFAYPYGEYDELVARETGACFPAAFTCEEGLNALNTHPLRLRRTMVQPGDSMLGFMCRIRLGWNPIAHYAWAWKSMMLSLIGHPSRESEG